MASPVRSFNMTGAQDIEMQDMGPNAPSRLLTLEAQHHAPKASHTWKGLWQTIRDAPQIPATRRIRDHEHELEAASKQHPECPQFWKDYIHLRDRHCAPLEPLWPPMIKYMVLQPAVAVPSIEWYPRYENETCLSDCLESIHQALVVDFSDSLILCALTAENPKSNSGLLHKVFNPLPSQIRRRREVPRRALIYLLSQRRDWHLSRKAIKELAEADTPLEAEQYQGLPSQKRSRESCIKAYSKDCLSLTLRWAWTAPKYDKNDTYIWQPYLKSPPFAYVKILVSNWDDPRNLRMLLLFQNKVSHTSFQDSFAQQQPIPPGETWFPASDAALAIIIAYEHAQKETSEFLRQASKEIIALTFNKRGDPAREKMQYLTHLKDCFKRVPRDLQQNLAQVREVVEKMRAIIPEGTPFIGNQIFNKLGTDADHILAELTKLERETDDLVHEIDFQRRFKNSNKLTWLALLYVPLSFATSFIGMLGSDPSTPPASQTSNTSSKLTSSQSSNITHNTPYLGSSMDAKYWRWKNLATPLLVFTIMTPLVFGPLFRFVYKHTILASISILFCPSAFTFTYSRMYIKELF